MNDAHREYRARIDDLVAAYAQMLSDLPEQDVATRAVLERVIPLLDRLSQDPEAPTSEPYGELLSYAQQAVEQTARFEAHVVSLGL